MKKVRLVVILGPTACGKTWLGVRVAHRLRSEIISADSRQVYRGLDIGTGKDLGEYATVDPPVPYHLIDVADVEDIYSLYHFQRDCYALLHEFAVRPEYTGGARPVLMVGGSGMYIEAVLRQFSLENVPEDIEFRDKLMKVPREELDERLRRADPERWARTDRTTAKRIVRALEVVEWARTNPIRETPPLGLDLDYQVFCVTIERSVIGERIRRRLIQRIEEGMIDEVRGLIARGVTRERLNVLGLEYRVVAAHLAGELTLDEMVEELALRIRQFAKRQQTWFRGMERRGVPITAVGPEDVDEIVKRMSPSG